MARVRRDRHVLAKGEILKATGLIACSLMALGLAGSALGGVPKDAELRNLVVGKWKVTYDSQPVKGEGITHQIQKRRGRDRGGDETEGSVQVRGVRIS